MTVKVIGLDTAKHVFQVHGADASGRAVLESASGGARYRISSATSHSCAPQKFRPALRNLWSAKIPSVATQPPFSSDNHGAIRREQASN
jgi:hypothetical protein